MPHRSRKSGQYTLSGKRKCKKGKKAFFYKWRRLKQQELAAAGGIAPSTSAEGQPVAGPSTSVDNLEVAQPTDNGAQPVAVFEEEPPPEPHVPAHPVPTAKICTLAVQPTRLRGIKKTTPRYEDVSQLISRINSSTTKGDLNCRLCGGESRMPLIPIFKNQPVQKVPLATKIFHITGLTVEEGDGYPESICQPCNKSMVNCYEFRTMCIATDERYRKKKKTKKSTNENSSDDGQQRGRPRKRAKKSHPVIDYEEPIDVKLEIEEHNIFDSASHFMSDGQGFEQHETVPPPFVTVKVEPEEENMWHPEVSLNSTQLPDTECKIEFEGDVVCESMEPPLDPLSIPAPDVTVSPPATGPQIPTLTVGNQPSANKRGTYLLAVKPVSASISDPPTYVLAIQDTAPAPRNIPANMSNFPVISNMPIPLNIRPDTATLPLITNVPVPITVRSDIVARPNLPIKTDIDPLDEGDSGAKQQ